MKFRFILLLLLLTAFAPRANSQPLNIIIISRTKASETLYEEFLQDIYRNNVDIQVKPNRYQENISASKKLEIRR